MATPQETFRKQMEAQMAHLENLPSRDEFITLTERVLQTVSSAVQSLQGSLASVSARVDQALASMKQDHKDDLIQIEKKVDTRFSQLEREQTRGLNYLYDKVRSLQDGEDGEDGQPGKDGAPGLAPDHQWNDTQLRFRNPDGTWGQWTDLKGAPGANGAGVTNMRIAQAFKYILKTEAPTGAINGSNTAYTVSQPIFAVLSFSLNGETIAQLPNYTISNKTITFSSALPAAYSGKDFEIKYI